MSKPLTKRVKSFFVSFNEATNTIEAVESDGVIEKFSRRTYVDFGSAKRDFDGIISWETFKDWTHINSLHNNNDWHFI
jgi:hypothetical protein